MYNIIPLTAEPNQSFVCTIPVDSKNVTLFFQLRYNDIAGYWVMTLTDASTGVILLDSVPVLTGEYPAADLLGQYQYLLLGSAVLINDSGDVLDTPSDLNMGVDYKLVWSDSYAGID